jgi:hypothetical protein
VTEPTEADRERAKELWRELGKPEAAWATPEQLLTFLRQCPDAIGLRYAARLISNGQAAVRCFDQLNVAVAKQAKIGGNGKAGKGSAHERNPVNWDVAAVRDSLLVELALWGDDILAIRRHPQAADIVSGIGRAVKDAFRAIDRMQERQYLGQCLFEEGGLTCHAEIWARPGAHQVTCTQCGITHEVGERRAWLLQQARDMLFTVKDASLMIGEVGRIQVTEASIRGYLHRKRIAYRPGGNLIRLGDLLAVVLDESERKTA